MKKIVDIIKEEVLKINEEWTRPYFTVTLESSGYLESHIGSFDRYKFFTYEDAVKALMKYFETIDAKVLFDETPNEKIYIAKETPIKSREETRYTVVKTFTIKDYIKFVEQNNISFSDEELNIY